MLNIKDIMETVSMIQEENLDIRTTTMGISLLDCADSDIDASCRKIYEKHKEIIKFLEDRRQLSLDEINKAEASAKAE